MFNFEYREAAITDVILVHCIVRDPLVKNQVVS